MVQQSAFLGVYAVTSEKKTTATAIVVERKCDGPVANESIIHIHTRAVCVISHYRVFARPRHIVHKQNG